jgi:hypothetical protein
LKKENTENKQVFGQSEKCAKTAENAVEPNKTLSILASRCSGFSKPG